MQTHVDAPAFGNDPFQEFTSWYQAAVASKAEYPDAMTLATVKADGKPAARTVLFKGLTQGGFQFFTNYESAKAKELVAKPEASLVFFWPGIYRQLRIEGHVLKITRAESEAYFATRARESQLGAWTSHQSSVISGATYLDSRFEEMKNKFKDQKVIPCPECWGGFRLVPQRFEFWTGNSARLHYRFFFEREDDRNWRTGWLAP